MDKTLVRARIEEIFGEFDPTDPAMRDDLLETLVDEFTKLEMEELFDIDAEDLDELDEG